VDPVIALLSISGAMIAGAISPGPSFVYVLRTSLAASRRDGLAAALGMGLGAAILASLALLGLRAVLAEVAWLYLGFKLVGGVYLIYLGYRLWRGARQPAPMPNSGQLGPEHASPDKPPTSFARGFALALATQLSNPKTVVVIGGVFAALLPDHVPLWMYLAIPPIVMLIDASWYSIVAIAASSRRPRAAYARSKTWIDRGAGTIMGILGGRLIYEAGSAV